MRHLTTLAALLALSIAPSLGDFLARSCAAAPCCATKSVACPMHRGTSSGTDHCRMRSCGHDDAPAQITPGVTVAHVVVSPAEIRPRRYAERDADLALRIVRRPESPPPRRA